jgi:EpsI family protein
VVLLLGGTLAASKWSDRRAVPDELRVPLDRIPLQIGDWSGSPAARLPQRVEARLLATAYLARIYRQKHREMSLFVTYYSQQRAGESMHSPKNCLPGEGWEAWNYGTVMVPVGSRNEEVNLYSIQKNGERMQALYWYQSPSRVIASEYAGKFYLVWDALKDGRTGGALVRLIMADAADTVREQVRFASLLMPEMQRCLGRD